jgi:hypothetical protein
MVFCQYHFSFNLSTDINGSVLFTESEAVELYLQYDTLDNELCNVYITGVKAVIAQSV